MDVYGIFTWLKCFKNITSLPWCVAILFMMWVLSLFFHSQIRAVYLWHFIGFVYHCQTERRFWLVFELFSQDKAFALIMRVLTAVKATEIEKAVNTLDKNSQDVLMKYIYRGFAEPSDGSSAVLLTWHEKVTKAIGFLLFDGYCSVIWIASWNPLYDPLVTQMIVPVLSWIVAYKFNYNWEVKTWKHSLEACC